MPGTHFSRATKGIQTAINFIDVYAVKLTSAMCQIVFLHFFSPLSGYFPFNVACNSSCHFYLFQLVTLLGIAYNSIISFFLN